jgi:polar amino acid transport system substrate-binding protein
MLLNASRHLGSCPTGFANKIPRVLCVILALSAICGAASAQSGDATRAKPALRVATRVIAPLVMKGARDELTGFSIDLWRAIARDSSLNFTLIEKHSLPELLSAVEKGEADLAVAAISITAEREETFDFSQPILESGLQILVAEAKSSASLAGILGMLGSPVLLEFIGMLLLLTLIPVPIIWLAERRVADGIVPSDSRRHGLLKSVWWSLTILAGQAEEQPKSSVGRIMAVIWMFASVLFIGYFTATAATMLTVQQLESRIRGPGDLPGKRVGTVAGSTAASYLAQQGTRFIDFRQFVDAAAALERGELDAVVYDGPVLRYYASHGGRNKARVIGPVFREEDYGILLPPNSALRKPINASLLRLRESGAYRAIQTTWFGSGE